MYMKKPRYFDKQLLALQRKFEFPAALSGRSDGKSVVFVLVEMNLGSLVFDL